MDKLDLQPLSDTNLRYISEVNEPWPLRPKVDHQGKSSILFLILSGGVMDLSTTLTTTFMRVNLHSPRGHTPFTRNGLGLLGQVWG